MFLLQHRATIREIRADLAGADAHAAHIKTHGLAGAAENIAAVPLAHAMRELEHAFEAGTQDIAEPLERADHALEQVLQSILDLGLDTGSTDLEV